MLFTPFYLPLVGLMALFAFSYLGLMPWGYKLQVLTMVYLFTILLPTILISIAVIVDGRSSNWAIRSAEPCLTSSPSSATSSASS